MESNLFLAYGLVILGLFLLASEIFLPSGILFVLAVGAIVVGVALSFSYSPSQGMITLIAVFVVIPILWPIILHYAPKTWIGKRLFLSGPDEDDTLATAPSNIELEQLRGRYGRTISALRPSGVTDFDGRRVDTISEGLLIEAGAWVKCVDVQAGRVVVRKVEKPPELDDFDTTDLT